MVTFVDFLREQRVLLRLGEVLLLLLLWPGKEVLLLLLLWVRRVRRSRTVQARYRAGRVIIHAAS
jgi:hypothetical protein